MSVYMAISLFVIFACGIYFLVMGMTDIISHNTEKQINSMTEILSHNIEERILKTEKLHK
ncbi:MAG: hypothetical protein KBF93_20195 [Leptospiraceae bacterium]|nr:hypothetical protein [Leptospiraceae bacterium]